MSDIELKKMAATVAKLEVSEKGGELFGENDIRFSDCVYLRLDAWNPLENISHAWVVLRTWLYAEDWGGDYKENTLDLEIEREHVRVSANHMVVVAEDDFKESRSEILDSRFGPLGALPAPRAIVLAILRAEGFLGEKR